MDFYSFFFVCTSYKSTFLNQSDNTWRHLRLHLLRLPPPFQRNISLAEWLQRLANPHCHVRVCVANTRVYMRPSSERFCTCFVLCARSRVCSPSYGYIFRTFPLCPIACVFTAVWLHIPDISSVPDRVCVHRRMVTHSGHFLLRYSHQTFLQSSQRASSSPPTHGCVFVCISPPAWLHLPDISLFTLATHSFSHICTLSNTHFCSCFHCHYYEVPFPNIRK